MEDNDLEAYITALNEHGVNVPTTESIRYKTNNLHILDNNVFQEFMNALAKHNKLKESNTWQIVKRNKKIIK